MKTEKIVFCLLAFGISLSPVGAAENEGSSAGKLLAQGEGLAKNGQWQKAQEFFLQACSEDPSNKVALHDLAVSYAHTNKLGEAADCERKALAIDDKYVPAHVELAWVLGKLDDKEAAREHLKRALEIEPENKIARKNLEAINIPRLKRSHDSAATPAIAGKAPAPAPAETAVSKALIGRGATMYRQGKYELSRRFFEQALQNCPSSSTARSSLGVVLGTMGDLDGQIREEHKVLEQEPKNALARVNLAWALAQKGDLKEALAEYQKAMELSPELVEAQVGQGLVLYRLGKPEAAVAVLKETVKIKPEAAQLRLAYGAILQSMGRNEECRRELQEAYRLNPGSSDTKVRLAAMLLADDEYQKAGELYKQLVEQNPHNSELRIGLGLALTKADDLGAAYQQFKKAVELDKNHGAAHACLSMIEEMRGKISQAQAEAKIAGELEPSSEFFKASAQRLAGINRSTEM